MPLSTNTRLTGASPAVPDPARRAAGETRRPAEGRVPRRARVTRTIVDHLLVAREQDEFDTAIGDAVAWLQHSGDDPHVRTALAQAHDAQRALRRLGRLQ